MLAICGLLCFRLFMRLCTAKFRYCVYSYTYSAHSDYDCIVVSPENELALQASKNTPVWSPLHRAQTSRLLKIKSKGITMTALLAKATALALTKHPVVNSSCRDGKSCTYNNIINIAVAVAIDGGLIRHVLHDADKELLSC